MLIFERGNCLQLNQCSVFHKKVCNEFPDNNSIKFDFDRILLNHLQACFADQMRERVFVNFLNKPNSQRVTYLVSASNDFLGYGIYIPGLHINLPFIYNKLSSVFICG